MDSPVKPVGILNYYRMKLFFNIPFFQYSLPVRQAGIIPVSFGSHVKTAFFIISFFSSITIACLSCYAQLNFNTSLSAYQLAQLLSGPGVVVTNVTTTCPGGASGSFTGGGSTNIGINSGIILTSGDVNVAKGPNNSGSDGFCNNGAGDGDLNNLTGGTSYDGCALEMDVVPLCDSISFRYVFGSDEYPEYVGSQFNDAFAFFISGPGITGTANIALVPGTMTAVTINNVNSGSYSQYYVDNQSGTTIEYDGFTTVLVAAIAVQPCQTYHLKLVIADLGDCIFDSGVFLEQNSLQCNYVVSVDATENSIESCSDDGLLSFCRPNADTFALTINYTIGGTAINGTDYQTIPDSITIPAGQTCVTETIVPIQDALTEGTETIKIIYQPGPCPVMDTVILLINEDAVVNGGPDANICSGDSTVIGPAPQGGWTYSWSPSTGLSATNVAQPTVSLINGGSSTISQNYVVTINMGGCTGTDTVKVNVTPGPATAFTAPSPVCVGQSVSFTNNSVPFQTCIGICPFCICTDNPTNYYWDFGDGANSTTQSPSHTYATAGTYTATLTMTDMNSGCQGFATKTIVVQPSGTLTLTVSPDDTICLGQSYTITVSGASSYSWTSSPAGFSSTSSTITVSPSVTTTYLVTGSSGCGSGNENVVVTVGSTMSVNSTKTDITCNGVANGSITVSPSGGSPPFTYAWSPNVGTGPTVSPLATGTYSVTVTDGSGCSGINSATITEPVTLAISASPVNVLCYGDSTGAITITVTGGTGIYSYLWSNGGMTSSINNLKSFTYSVTVTDGNGCTLTGSYTLTQPSALIISMSQLPPACADSNGAVSAQVSGGSPPYAYSWSGTGQNNDSLSGIPAGIYSVTVTDGNGCMVSDTSVLTGSSTINGTIASSTNANCSGDSSGTATASASGSTPPYTYLWLPSNQNTATATGLKAGNYTVIISDASGCGTSVLVTITAPPPIAVTEITTAAKCFGSADGVINITVSGGSPSYSYAWSNASQSEDLTGSAGYYTVTITDSKSCTFVFGDSITQPTDIVLLTNSSPATCGLSDGAVAVTASGGTGAYTYLWMPGNYNTDIVPGLSAGAYTVNVTDANGCTKTDLAIIINPGAPTLYVSALSNVTCNGSADGTITAATSGGTPPFTFTWNTNPVQTGPAAVNLAAGTYIVTVTDSAGCISAMDTSISEPDSILVSVYGADTICAGESAPIGVFASGGTLPFTYIWDNNLGQGDAKIVSPTVTTTYTVIVIDGNNCTGSAQSVTIALNGPLNVIAAGAVSICEGDAAVLTAAGGGGDGGPYSYTWSNGNTGNSITVTPSLTTKYYVTVTDNCGTSPATDSVTVTVQPQLLLTPPSAAGCPGDKFTLVASGAITYWWSDADSVNDTIAIGPQITVSPSATTYYLIHGFDGVCEGIDTVPVTITPPPVADFTAVPEEATMIYPNISFFNLSSADAVSWFWQFGDGDTDTSSSTVHLYPDTGLYIVWLKVTNGAGCTDSISKNIRIQPEFMLFMPAAITPNGDGKNDLLFPEYIGVDEKNYHLYIYDRWGDLVFETTDIHKSWNGIANVGKKAAQQDVFIWIIEARDLKGRYHTFIGHVTLVK